MYKLQNRRYLWNKFKLLNFIDEVMKSENVKYKTFTDIFAWTGVVWEYFNNKSIKIISNDILLSNFCSINAFLNARVENLENVKEYIKKFNEIEISNNGNYVSKNYGNKYFDKNNAKLIWQIREKIEELKLEEMEKYILISSLLYATDKIANTCWHYSAFRKKLDKYPRLKLEIPDINFENNKNNEVYNEDANELVKRIETDVLYIDPPYNSRQYFNSYHVLENITKWDAADLEWITKQRIDRNKYKSEYCSIKAKDIFRDLIQNAKAKYIIVSYNNTGEKLDARSNSRIKENEILSILWEKWEVKKYEKDYKFYTTWKNNDIKNHKEILYFCRVK